MTLKVGKMGAEIITLGKYKSEEFNKNLTKEVIYVTAVYIAKFPNKHI